MPAITDAKILILATDGFQQSELETPRDKLRELGAIVHVATLDGREIKGWDGDDWGDAASADLALKDAEVADYDGLILPGSQINPDVLRVEPGAVELIKAFAEAGKIVAAVDHAPSLLIEAGLADGCRMTGYISIRTDLANAGATVVYAPVVADHGIVTSRKPSDLDAFVAKIVTEIESCAAVRDVA